MCPNNKVIRTRSAATHHVERVSQFTAPRPGAVSVGLMRYASLAIATLLCGACATSPPPDSGAAATRLQNVRVPLAESAAPTTPLAAATLQSYSNAFAIDEATLAAAVRSDIRLGDSAAALKPPPNWGRQLNASDGFIDRSLRNQRIDLLQLYDGRSKSVYFGITKRGIIGMHVDMHND